MSETPTLRRGFGALFEDAKSRLDSLQHSMSGLLPSMPGLPVAKYFDIAIGVDFHESVFPLSPLLPVPHIGMVFDIMGAMMSAISTVVPEPASSEGDTPSVSISNICKMLVHSMKPSVQVHGQWVANAGTSIQHLPGVFVHLPFPIIKPMASSEMWMGSSTVLMDGGPCSTQFHPALSCNLIGIPAPIRPKKVSKPKVSLMAPTSMLTIMASAGKPVLVGGPPTIDLFQLSMQLGLKGMGKLWKKTGDIVKKVPDNLPTMGLSKARCSSILGVKITPPKAKNTDNIVPLPSGVKPNKLNEIKPDPPFKVSDKHKGKIDKDGTDLEKEFNRQLSNQEKAINEMSVQDWLDNREYFKNNRKDYNKKAKEERDKFRKEEFNRQVEDNITNKEMTYEEAVREAHQSMKGKDALHNPDGVAGGQADAITDLGNSRVNSSIGSQWKNKKIADNIEDQVKEQIKNMGIEIPPNSNIPEDLMMNVKLL